MKLSEHTLLTLRCEMTARGYRWKRDADDRSLDWRLVDHWELWEPPGLDFPFLALRPIVSCGGDLLTGDVACIVKVNSNQSLDTWELTESFSGSAVELDSGLHQLADLPKVLRDWVRSWPEVGR